MKFVSKTIFGLICFSAASHAGISFYALKDAYDANPSSPKIYRFDGISNFQSGTHAVVSTRASNHGSSSDIAIDEQGRFYFVKGDPSQTTSKEIWRWNSLADWGSNSEGTKLGVRSSTAQISGFSVYQNEFYFFEGDPDRIRNKTLRKWSSATSWGNGDAGTLLGSRATGAGLGFEIDAGGAVWFLDSTAKSYTSGKLYRWNSINNFITNTGGTNYGGSFNFLFEGTFDQIAGLAVPEPSALSLLAVGLGGLAMIRRRRS